ncbi:BglG family transcription antiterminator [Alkalicoccus urumqiensis]|uniref:Uncharacterized protein n=1 Tax=Alkalicoccus urumqiensis TaxID=1548213 RepID=A0A2P6MLJ5_ALKUR|nr:PRD domain-containing protein [Alkalicoccus urumqiensis]PRO67152.1 hypothetical protein C6I21_00880 [Alkalicoccus urumqiensis]
MYVSARDRRILEELSTHPDGVTIKTIADRLDVSERTIHRDLASFDSLLRPYELTLEKKAGRGIRLAGSSEQLEQFQEDVFDSAPFDFMPEQRQLLLTYKLLTALEPVKLTALASDLHVAGATVSHDLDAVAENLEQYHLTLLRRRGFGVQVTGSEAAKRRAIRGLLSDQLSDTELLRFIRRHHTAEPGERSQSISDQLLGFVRTDRLSQIEAAVDALNQRLDTPIADSSYIALVVHLALAMERISQGEKVDMKPELLDQLEETAEYPYAEALAEELGRIFEEVIPKAEVGYITMHLRGAKLQSGSSGDTFSDNLLLTRRLMKHASLASGVDFTRDTSLEEGLAAHLGPALYRMEQEMTIHNPLLETIQSNYTELYSQVKEAADHVFPYDVPPDEIGYLVLHFGSALETGSRQNVDHVYVICSSGIGSSKLMASRLHREFPEIRKLIQMSLFDLGSRNLGPEDAVISTIPIDAEHIDYIQVNPFLTDEEVQRVARYLSRKAAPAYREKNEVEEDPAGALQSMQEQLNSTMRLLHHTAVIEDTNTLPLWTSMYNTMELLASKSLVSDPEAVTDALQKRESLSGIGLPGTALALHHARHAAVKEPVFLLLERQEPEPVKAMDGSTIEARRIGIMLAPEELSEQQAAMMSTISGMLVQNSESTTLFETGTEKDIKTFMSSQFLSLLRSHPYE